MLVQEPILAPLTLYMGFIYGFLYLCFEAFPIAFEEYRGWDIGIGSLPFLSITVGALIGVVIFIVHTMTRMRRKLEAVGDAPEERLVPMIIGSVMMPTGIFWFAWHELKLEGGKESNNLSKIVITGGLAEWSKAID
ncbi:unnamed protein product [Penicillium discolor]